MFASLKIKANDRMTVRLTQDSALSMFIVHYNVAQIAGKSKYNKAASGCLLCVCFIRCCYQKYNLKQPITPSMLLEREVRQHYNIRCFFEEPGKHVMLSKLCFFFKD